MDEVARYVKQSTAAQGLPERLEDPKTIAQVVAMLGGGDDARADGPRRLRAAEKRQTEDKDKQEPA